MNKRRSIIFVGAVSLIASSIFFYLCGGFIAGTFNSSEWDQGAKVMGVFFDLALTTIILVVWYECSCRE